MAKNNPYKTLIGNSIIFAIGNIGSKLITFLMLPLYTYTLTKNEYGVTDIAQTTVSFLLPVVYLSISDAVLRFGLDERRHPTVVFSTGISVTNIISLITLAVAVLLQFFHVQYSVYVGLLLIAQSYQSVLAQMAKAVGKQRIFAANGILLALMTAVLNIIALTVLKWGVVGYFISFILGLVLSDIYLSWRIDLPHILDLHQYQSGKLKNMLRYSVPLIPNAISWWASNDINRYLILFFLGTTSNGIFAVASKMPSILNLLNSIFFQSWQLSAIDQYGDSKSDKFYTTIFRFYSQFLFVATLGLICFSKVFMFIIVSPKFYVAWEYTPFLLITVLYQCLSGLIGQVYVAAKKTKSIFTTTLVGMVINVGLTALLLPLIGLQGAGIASALSFLAVWLIRHFEVKKFVTIGVDWLNIIINNVLLLAQTGLLFLKINVWLYSGISAILIGFAFFLDRSIIVSTVQTVQKKLANRGKAGH